MAAEGRLPRGAILLLSAALALFAYGGWYYLSNREPGVADMVAQVTFTLPNSRLHEQEARMARAELDLRQTVLDLVQEAETRKVERAAAQVKIGYRDLYLDRSRALYELEVRTDLGDAMTQMTTAQWEAAQAEFRLALTWAKIDALTGQLLPGHQMETKPQEKSQ